MSLILVESVEKKYEDKVVLNKINLEINQGEIFGLLGPSGAGKTTMIRLLTGQISATAGKITVFDKEVGKLNGTEKKQFGIMMDQFGLYERLSCYDNLKLFADIYGIKKEQIIQTLRAVGLEKAVKTPAMNLSKGMRHRLQLARVFMTNPKILFLDEPTSGLDPATSEEIHRLLLHKKEMGYLIFLTTHNMGEAEKLCDHIALLNEGKIVEYGQPQEICRKYNHQKKIRIRLKNGEELEYENSRDSAAKIEQLFQEQSIETIHSTEPNLETVFMERTGRRFE
ncbi:MAG TPA: ABC transporter ATP-binding protein [Lachnospiraceae bacterium]|nr:ABC transporter ATP-binding protein [Lachnospiraceae bacterium]